jgi:hypothetical protein
MFNATAPTLAGNPPRPATVNVTLPFAGTAAAVGTPIANRVSNKRAGARILPRATTGQEPGRGASLHRASIPAAAHRLAR